jgi:hypothetical protein
VTRYTETEVVGFAQNAGWTGKDLLNAVSVSFAECGSHDSTCYNGTCCYGLWQINHSAHPQFSLACITDGQCNANAAYTIWRQQGWGPWTTWPVAAAAHRAQARRAIQAAGGASGGTDLLPGFNGHCSSLTDPDARAACNDCQSSHQKGTPPLSKADLEACIIAQVGGTGAASGVTSGSICSSPLGKLGPVAVVCTFGSIEDAVKGVVGAFIWLASPSHWIRVAEVIGGAVLILLAIVALLFYAWKEEKQPAAGGA